MLKKQEDGSRVDLLITVGEGGTMHRLLMLYDDEDEPGLEDLS